MDRCDRNEAENPGFRNSSDLEGTGDGENRLSKLSEIKSKEEGELIGVNRKTVISPSPVPFSDLSRSYGQNDIEDFEFHIARVARGLGGPEADDLLAFLRANPGMTTRDWKGKGPSVPLTRNRARSRGIG